jgi:hypothetical protein
MPVYIEDLHIRLNHLRTRNRCSAEISYVRFAVRLGEALPYTVYLSWKDPIPQSALCKLRMRPGLPLSVAFWLKKTLDLILSVSRDA